MERRQFIKQGSMLAGAAAFPNILRAGASGQKVRMGFIGVGNRGTQVMHLFMDFPDVEVTAICDVYKPYLDRDDTAFDPKFLEWGLKGRLPIFRDRTGNMHKHEKRLLDDIAAGRCKKYTDYRKLLEDKNVDAVYIGTPDHWHALMTVDAIRAGKDVYCEKPLTATIFEGQKMVEVAKASKQVTCTGLNRRGCVPYQLLKKEIDSGRYGEFRMGRAARSSNIFPNGLGKCAPCEPPKGFDWDAWLGPRAYRPYKYTTAPYFFRWHTEFSSQVGNWGVHYLDAMRWMMDETWPCAVTAIGGKYYTGDRSDSEIPDTMFCIYEFADGKVMEFNVFEGGRSRPIAEGELELTSGDAVIYAEQKGWSISPTKRREFNNKPVHLFEAKKYEHKEALLDDGSAASCTNNVIRDFLDRVKDRGECLCSLEQGHISTGYAHLANISYALGGVRLLWDAKTQTFTNSAEANKMLHYGYRAGYTLG